MLIYVIPFILVLVIAIVLKKRDANKQAEQTSTAKSKAKKASASKKTPQKTQVVRDSVVEQEKTTPLVAEQRNKIEALIRAGDFSVAEAQINQALNKNNSQHELYLLLLDIHILQKDEFATGQLINHLRSLELDDILEQALAKKALFTQDTVISQDQPTFKQQSPVTAVKNSAVIEQKRAADFDALIDTPAVPVIAEENKPLEFHTFSVDSAPTVLGKAEAPETVIEEIKALDFHGLSVDLAPTAAPKAAVPKPAVDEIIPLDFSNLTLAPETPVASKQEVAPIIEEVQALDFSFSLDTVVETPSVQSTAVVQPAEVIIDDKLEFDFDFSSSKSTTTIEAEVATEPTLPSLDLDFNLEPAIGIHQPALESAPAETSDLNFNIPTISTSSVQADEKDPLIQSFPELLELNEMNLNLELVKQYIQLGAFTSARELLEEQAAEYTVEQRQQAEQLRNQIAY